MTTFNPTGSLNVSLDPSDIKDGDFVRCKNLRIEQQGVVKTRDGSTKLNSSAIDTDVWHIEEQAGVRYVFAGDEIYEDESSILSGLTEAQWSALQYSAFNDPTKNIFALNGTDRKRIQGGTVYEWGIEAPTSAPVLSAGSGVGLTGKYNARYTYVRKVDNLIVSESDPSPASDEQVNLEDRSLAAHVQQSSDPQVTHLRLYRTLSSPVADIWYLDQEVTAANTFDYGHTFAWEAVVDADTTLNYFEGNGYKFTIEDSRYSSNDTYSWEELFEDREDIDDGSYGTDTETAFDFENKYPNQTEGWNLP